VLVAVNTTALVLLLSITGALALVIVLSLIARAALRKVAAMMTAEIATRFSPEAIRRQDTAANYFGRESLGMGQVRGNGGLVLTHDTLWFMLAVPRREVTIPLNRIEAVEVRRKHLGKRIGRDLVYVRWSTDEGPDAAAWCVRDPAAWITALEAARSG